MCWECNAVLTMGKVDTVCGLHLIEHWFWLPRIRWTRTYLCLAWGCFFYLKYRS